MIPSCSKNYTGMIYLNSRKILIRLKWNWVKSQSQSVLTKRYQINAKIFWFEFPILWCMMIHDPVTSLLWFGSKTKKKRPQQIMKVVVVWWIKYDVIHWFPWWQLQLANNTLLFWSKSRMWSRVFSWRTPVIWNQITILLIVIYFPLSSTDPNTNSRRSAPQSRDIQEVSFCWKGVFHFYCLFSMWDCWVSSLCLQMAVVFDSKQIKSNSTKVCIFVLNSSELAWKVRKQVLGEMMDFFLLTVSNININLRQWIWCSSEEWWHTR